MQRKITQYRHLKGVGALFVGTALLLCVYMVHAQTHTGSTVKTLYVFPEHILTSDWENVDALYTQAYDNNALYQDFKKGESAYLEIEAQVPIEMHTSTESTVTGGEEEVSAPAVEGGEIEVFDNGEGVEGPDAKAESQESVDAPEVPESPAAQESVEESASLPAGPFALAKNKLTLLLGEVVSQAGEVFGVSEESDTVSESEAPTPVSEESVLAEGSANVTEVDLHHEEGATDIHDHTDIGTGEVVESEAIQALPSEDISSSTSATSTEGDVAEIVPSTPRQHFCEGSVECDVYDILFEGFDLPNLEKGEFIQDAQLRLSLGGKVKKTSPVAQGLLIEYSLDGTWNEAGSISLTDEVSNALNGGYFLYALPEIANVDALAHMQVRITYMGDQASLEGLFIDSAWIELGVLTLTEEELRARVLPDALDELKKPEQHEFLGKEIDFPVEEMPRFALKYTEQRNFVVRFFRSLFADKVADVERITVRHNGSGELALHPQIHMTDDGLWTIQIPEEERSLLIPGRYTLEIEVHEGGALFVDEFEFQWGVLALNTHKSEYEVGEVADLSFAALSQNGNTVCDARLLAYVIMPDGFVSRSPVKESGLCNGNNVVDVPDYTGSYQTHMLGTHTLYLEWVNAYGEALAHAEDTFEVVAEAPLQISRKAPTRIYPVSPYTMELTVSAREAFTGSLIEQIPLSYEATSTDAILSEEEGVKKLTWNSISLAPGESKTFSYTFDSPDISPYLYMLGPASFVVDGEEEEAPATSTELIGVENDSMASSTPEIVLPEVPQGVREDSLVTVDGVTEVMPEQPSEEGDGTPTESVDENTAERSEEQSEVLVEPLPVAIPETLPEPESESTTISLAPPTEQPLFQSAYVEDVVIPVDVEEGIIHDSMADTATSSETRATTTSPTRSFTEKRKWQIASDATGSMLLYWDSVGIPSGWTCVSCAPAGAFYQRFVMGSSTAGTNGGAATHTHTATGAVTASGGTQGVDTNNQATPVVAHTHTYTPTISSDSHLPPYRQLAIIQYNSAGEPPAIPTGAIALFDAAVPTGWTRYSAQDGNFIRGESTSTIATTGGAATHTHTVTGNTGAAASTLNARNPGTSVAVAAASHTHTVSTSTGPVSNLPPYREALLGKINATSSATDAMIAMWTDTPSAGWNTVSSSTEAFENRFVRASTTYGATGGASTHSHSNITGATTGSPSATVNRDSTPVNGSVASAGHTHSVNITSFTTVSNLPPYRTAIFAKRLGGTAPDAPVLHDMLFDSEKTGTSTPVFEFTGSDPDGSDTLTYQFQWDDDGNLDDSPLGDRTSDVETGCSPNCFENTVNGGDSSPFNDAERIRFSIQDALDSGVTYYWRVRAKETVGDTWGGWSAVTSFTYIASTDPSQWYQTEGYQFETGTLVNIATTSGSAELSVPTLSGAMVVYGEGVVQTPRYQLWNGTAWGGELSANSVGSTIEWIRTKAAPTRDEYIVATQDTANDVNVQIYSGTSTSWGTVREVTTSISDPSRRGFDVAYETLSGDALVVYCDGDSDPSYDVWNGGWTGPTTITTVSANNCNYISLASDPNSDEIILVTRDTGSTYEALVWDGSAWGNSRTIGSMSDTNHEGIAVEYEESGDQAVVVTSNGTTNGFIWNAWSGSSWNGSNATAILGDDFEWGVLKRDVGTDNMALCYMDQDSDVGIVRWNGLGWETSQEIDINGNLLNGRAITCEFETTAGRDGNLMIPYSTTTQSVYDVWNGSTFAGDQIISTIQSSWEVGSVRTGDGNILAYFHDDANTRYDFSYWNGTSWSTREMLEDTTSVGVAPFKQPIGMAAQVYQSGDGIITSEPIDFDWVSSQPTWGEILWNTTEPAGTDVVFQVAYGPTCASLVPDGALTGNSTGFDASESPLDISGLSTSTYNQLCLKATLSSVNASLPSLDDWTLSWEREPYLVQSGYQWYVNESSITPTDPWPVGATDLLENEPIESGSTLPGLGTVLRLRTSVRSENVALSASELAFKLQYASGLTCASSTTWFDVGAIGSSTAEWRGYNTSGVSDGATISSLLLTFSDVGGSYEEENNSATNPNTININDDGEWDWVLEHNGEDATQYCFRTVTASGVPLALYEQYPTLVTNTSPGAPVLVTPFDNEKTATTTPVFQFSAADAESDDVTYQIQIDDDYLFGSVAVDKNSASHGTQFENLTTPADKDPFTNGEAIEFHLTSALSNGTTYYWRVRGEDPSGSVDYGEWSEVRSFTIDTSLTASAWFQTDDGQFETDTLEDTATSSDTVILEGGFTAGTTTGSSIDFDWGTSGNAWGSLAFTDTETSSDLKYQIEYFADEAWTAIPESDLVGNTAGFDSSPVNLLGLDTETYNVIRIVAKFTDAGASPVLSDWTINWGFKILPPTIDMLFANEQQATTTPTLQFYAEDPQNDALVYQVQWSTSYAFTSSTTRTSSTSAGFANIDTPLNTTPFNSGETIQFTIQAADALIDNTTYWWRVRAKDPLGSDSYSDFTDPQSFTVSSTTSVSTWFQTTAEQFLTDTITGATTSSALQSLSVATTANESLVAYAEGTSPIPRYRLWDGASWGSELQAETVDAAINWVVVKPGETREEYLMGTLSTDGYVNVQVYENGAWGNMQEITTDVPNTVARGFDIAYENVSGDAMVVSCDGDADPTYYIWDGTWTLGGTISLASSNSCAWVRLASDPTSDELILVARDSVGSSYELVVWNATTSTWGNATNLGFMNESTHEGLAVSYEESGNQAVVAASNGVNPSFVWKAWSGSAWSATTTVALGDDFEMGSLVSDVGSDNMALCYVDEDNDIGVLRWTGAAFVATVELETGWAAGSTVKNDRPIDCAFEVGGARDGYIMVAYSDTTNVRYRSWNGATWVAEASVSTIEDSARVQLRRTSDNLIQLVAYDMTNDDYNYSYWNGTSWSVHQTLETDGNSGAYPYKEGFMIAARNPGTSASVVGNPEIIFSDGSGPYWQQLSWNDSESGGSSILYQVEYYNSSSGTWDLVPDGLIPGNSVGTSTSPISLTGVLPVSTYAQLRPVAHLSCSLGVCPQMLDWTLTWAAGITVSGTARAYDQSTNVTSGTVAVALNGVLQTGKTGTISGGTWSIANVNASAGDTVTVFVQGAADSNEAVGVATYDGVGDMSGITLFERHLSIGSNDFGTTTNAQLGLYDFSNSEDLFFNVNATNDLTVCATTGCADAELYVQAGNVYQPGGGGDVDTHDFENNGTFLPNGNTVRVSGSWDNNATATLATSSLIFTATSTSETIDDTGAIAVQYYNLTFGETSGSATWTPVTSLDVNGVLTTAYGTFARGSLPITVAGNLINGAGGLWTGVGTTTFDGATGATWTDSAATKQNIGDVVIDGTSKTVTFGSNVRAQSVTIGTDDILDASGTGFDITLLRNWTNNNTFTARTGEVIFAATTTNAVVTQGSSNFYDLTFNGVGGSWSFVGSTVTVGNDFTVATGTVTMPTGTTTIAGSFNSTGGLFAHNNGAVTFSSTGAETITLAGAHFTNTFYNLAFTGSGSWSFVSAYATTSNDLALSAGTVTFPSGVLALGGSLIKSGGTIAANNGTLQLTSATAETIQLGASSLASIYTSGSGSWSFVDASVTATGNVTVGSGTVTLPSGTLTVGGSFSNTATFAHNSGTVLFNATTTGKTISPGTSWFYNTTFNSAAGGWTIAQDATTTNAFTLTNASSFALSSGAYLSVGGAFTNSVGGASTTWTGSNLALKSNTSFAINSKTNNGDEYGTLILTGTTSPSMWFSSSTVYSLSASSSLYSQDHSGVDGDLYIFGAYARTSGTEHWSYATDFDGTALGGSSRQVDVRFASGATASLSTSALSIVGTSTASTTIAAQSGTYTIALSGGTTTASHYRFADLGLSGITLGTSTKVTTLSDGYFAPGSNGGAALTVSSSTIDANPALQISRVEFATTTAISAFNVTQMPGTPLSYWWFRESIGNLQGEVYDNDTGDPGSIRWDDSNLVITVSGTVYADEGATPLGAPTCDDATQNVKIVVDGGASYTGVCSSADGTYSIPGVVIAGDPVLTTFLNTNGGVYGTVVTQTPTQDITNLNIYANRVMVRHEDAAVLTIADMAVYDETHDTDVRFDAVTGVTPSLTVRPDTELHIHASSTFAPEGPVTLESGGTGNTYDGSLHIDNDATFTALGTTTYTIGGRFAMDIGGTFTAASSTVVMTATTTNKTITTPTPQTITFNNLSFTGSNGEWPITADITVLGDMTVSAGTVSGDGDIGVTYGSLSGNGTVALTGGTVTLARTNTFGGTTPWTFNNLTLGNGSVAGTTTPAGVATTTIGGVLTIAAAHVLDANASSWNLAGVGTPLLVTGTLSADTSTIRYSATSSANITSTTYYNLDLNGSAGTPTFTGIGVGISVLNDLIIGGGVSTAVDFNVNDPAVNVDGAVYIRANGTLGASASSAFTVGGSWDTDGAFTPNAGTVTFDSASAATISPGASSFASVVVNKTGTFTVVEHATATAAFTLTAASAFTVDSGVSLAVGGTFTNSLGGGATTWTGSTLSLSGGSNYQINASTTGDTYGSLLVGANTDIRMWNSDATAITVASSGSLYSQDHANVNGALYIYGDYARTSGSDYWSYATDFDGTALGGGSRAVTVSFAAQATATYSGASLNIIGGASASTTITNQGSGTYAMVVSGGTLNAQYYRMRNSSATGLVLTGTPTVTSLSYGDFEVAQNGGTALTVGGTVITQNPAKTFTGNSFATSSGVSSAFNVVATGTTISSWRFTNHIGSIDGESYDSDPGGDPGYVVWDDSAAQITISGTVYSDEGSTPIGGPTCDGSTHTVHLRVAGLTSFTTYCDAGTGAYSIPGVAFSPGDTLVVYLDTAGGATAANVTVDPISSIGNMDLYENRAIVRHEDTNPITIADMSVWDSSDDADIPFTAVDSAPDTLTLPANTKLIVWGGKTFAPGGNVTVSGGGGGAAYDGTLELYTGAAFTAAGTESHTIGGSLVSGSSAVITPAQATFTFTTTGASRTIDTNNGSLYNATFNGSGSWVSSDTILSTNNITITQGALTLPSGTTTVAGSFENTGGSFAHASGTLYFTATSGGKTIRPGTSALHRTIFNGSGGAWSFVGTHATTTENVTIAAGAVTLPSGTYVVNGAFNVSGGSFVHNLGTVKLTGAGASTTLNANGSDFSSLTVETASDYVMTETNVDILGTLRISQGVLRMATGTVSIGGSLLNTGGSFAHASGTILFNSADTGETVNPGSSSFNHVVFAGASGGWTISAHATATGNFSLTSASQFTLSSSTTLYVGGVFTNTVGGSATTWTGSTVTIETGTNYTINTSSTGGDQYQTLVIGPNTDLRMWNSAATTTTLASSSSLYSQDHANVNGALYIYGDYARTSGSDYWSYATDFDGTALGGGSRAVTVSFAAQATATYSGASLNIIGGASASTTITNQGSGTYALVLEDGTLNATHFVVRNGNVDGLTLLGLTTVSALSYGDFELAVSGGSLVTLASSTLNANASLTVSGMRFATTTAITGSNITLVGSTPSAWTFTSHTGNLAGESYDIDGGDACGSLRWTDSTCLITEQTHYRWRNDNGGEGVPDSEWYDQDWSKRKRVVLTNADAVAYTDAVIKVPITFDADMQTDFDDLRFTDESGTTTIPYWIETYTASTNATVWVQVPTLAASGATSVFVYYGNGGVSDASSGATTFSTFDDFEDANITEYSNDTSLFTTGATTVYERTRRLVASNVNGRTTHGIHNTSATVSQGETVRFLQYVDATGGAGDEGCTLFGVQAPGTGHQNYAVCVELYGVDRVSLAKNVYDRDDNTGTTVLASSTLTWTTGWHEVEVRWDTDDSMDVTVRKDGSVVATTSATDSSYTSGGIGFTFWTQHGAWDVYTSRPLLATEPTVGYGVEQVSGGASWYAALDTAAPGVALGTTQRLRFAVENFGLPITSQNFLLEYAEKDIAPNCEAVSAGSYAPVPPQASCGTSPVCMKSSSYFADQASTTDHIVGDGTFAYGQIIEDPSHKTGDISLDANYYTEVEYALEATTYADAASYCFRVSNDGTDIDSYARVAELRLQFAPSILSWSFNNGEDITVTPGATTTIYATGTVSDANGYTDLLYATSTFYRSGVGQNCTADNNNCYQLSGGSCAMSNCSGNSCDLTCSADIYFFADPTDFGAYSAQDWRADLLISDTEGSHDTQSTFGSELTTMRALDVNSSIAYGALAVAEDTGSNDATTTVENIGNDAIDVSVSGTDLSDGVSSVIPATTQKYATSTFTYSSCTFCSTLSNVSVPYEVDLSKPTTTTPVLSDDVFWGIAIPFGASASPHTGVNTFMATAD